MKGGWACSSCGMASSRHWNVARHIKNQHNGEGQPLPHLSYILETIRGQLPYPTYPAAKRPVEHKPRNILRFMVERAEKATAGAGWEIGQSTEAVNPYSSVHAKICSSCLSPVYEIWELASMGSGSDRLVARAHSCDVSPLFDFGVPTNEEQGLIVKDLQARLPELMMSLVRGVYKNDQAYYITTREEPSPYRAALEPYALMYNRAFDDVDVSLQMHAKITSLMDRETQKSQHFIDIRNTEWSWLSRMLHQKCAQVSESQVSQIVKTTLSTTVGFKTLERDGWYRFYRIFIVHPSYPHLARSLNLI